MEKWERTQTLRELHGLKLFGYAVGNFGYMFPLTLISGFTFQFYVYTIGLDSLLTSIGLFLGSMTYGIFSIIFGVVIDNKQPTKLGKRRIFLLVGVIPLIITGVTLWTPPWKCPPGNTIYLPTALYFWGMMILFRIAHALLSNAYNSMLPEQAQTESNRVKIATVQTFLLIFSNIIGMFLPMVFQALLEDPKNAKWWDDSGRYLITFLPWIAGLFGLIALIFVIITFFSVDESFHLLETVKRTQHKSIKEGFAQIFIPLQDPIFSTLILVFAIAELISQMLALIIVPFMTFVIGLGQEQFILCYLAGMPLLFIGFAAWREIIKKKPLFSGLMWNLFITLLILLLGLLFFFNLPFWFKVILGIFVIGGGFANIFGKYMYYNPLISRCIDNASTNKKIQAKFENTRKNNISGSYFGMQQFSSSIGIAIGNLILGVIFTGTNAENPRYILAVFPLLGLFSFLGWGILSKLLKKMANNSIKSELLVQ